MDELEVKDHEQSTRGHHWLGHLTRLSTVRAATYHFRFMRFLRVLGCVHDGTIAIVREFLV
jgi:hypothetical protein